MSSAAARRGVALVIAAPSGAGKSTIARAVLAAETGVEASVSATTRQKRPGERDGIDYHFVNDTKFQALIEGDELLEWATVFGRCYGTKRAPVAAALAAGRDVIFDIDWQGWRQLKQALPGDAVGVFILPPSLAALRGRLERRAGDAAAEIERRLQAALGEISHWREFDHVVVNDDLENCIADVRAVLRAARTSTARRDGLADLVASLGGAD